MATPFGIRRRIKAMLGMGEQAKDVSAAREKVGIKVVGPNGAEQEGTAYAGSTILAASGNLRRPIASGCAQGDCGTCRVEVLEGAENLTESNPRERATLKANNHPETYRLACRTEIVKGECKVRAFELV